MIDTKIVPVDLGIAAMDETQAGYLVHFVETALGPKCRFLINYVLTPAEETKRNWAVTLPLNWTVGALTDVPIGDDPKNRLWTTTVTTEVSVEVATWARYETPFAAAALSINPTEGQVTITVPSEVHVGSQTPLYVDRRPADSRWKVDDISLARITSSEHLYAKRAGAVNVSLISSIKPGDDPYASQAVQIVP
jgi:hypothetical protein